MNKDMAYPVRVLNHRHPSMLDHRRDQTRSTPRNQKINHPLQPAHFCHTFPSLVLDECDHLRRQSLLFGRRPQSLRQSPIAFFCLTPPSQKGRIARFQAKYGTVHRHIGARLINDSNQTDRHPNLRNLQSVRTGPLLHHLTHRIGKFRNLPHSLHHLPKPLFRQLQPVEKGARGSCRPRCYHIFLIRLTNLFFPQGQLIRHREQQAVLFLCA